MFKKGVKISLDALPMWVALPKMLDGKPVARSLNMNLHPGDEFNLPGTQSFIPVTLNGFDLDLNVRFETDELSPLKLVTDKELFNRYLVSSVALQYAGLSPVKNEAFFMEELRKQANGTFDDRDKNVMAHVKKLAEISADAVMPMVTMRFELNGSWALNPEYPHALATFTGELSEAVQHNYNVGVSPVHLVDALKILKLFGKSYKNETEVIDSLVAFLPEDDKQKALNEIYGGTVKHTILRNVKNCLRDVSKIPAFKR